jgi:hypothetical protein
MMWMVGIPESIFNHPNGDKSQEMLEELRKFSVDSKISVQIDQVPVGMGADFPTIGVQVLLDNWELVLAAAFFLGKKIEENTAAWFKMTARVSRAITTLAQTYPGSPDVRLEAILALNEVRSQFESARTLRLCGAILTPKPYGNFEHTILRPYDIRLENKPIAKLEYTELLRLREYNSRCQASNIVILIDVDDRDLYAISRSHDGSVKSELLISRQ